MVIQSKFFPVHFSCWMCFQSAFFHQFGIDIGRTKIEQQTDSILSACGSHGQNHKDPENDRLERTRVMHSTCTLHGRDIKTRVFWVDINFAFGSGWEVYQTRSNAIILQETLPAYCIPKVVRMENAKVMYEKVHMSPRFGIASAW